MSEYWKSIPKYWCQHCKAYVRDTKLEKANHEATGKHQGNLNRFIREIHKTNEREERDKRRAKDEIARLNIGPISSSDAPATGLKRTAAAAAVEQHATPEERRRHMAQLAAMGVAVPEEFRREVTMASDWQVISQKSFVEEIPVKKEESEDIKPVNIGIRKRKVEEGVDEEEEQSATRKRPVWGSTTKAYKAGAGHAGLDALLDATTSVKGKTRASEDVGETQLVPDKQSEEDVEAETIKQEILGPEVPSAVPEAATISKRDDDGSDFGILFKKKKLKNARNG